MSGEQRGLFAEPAPKRVWTLSPSEFGFLWQECRRCYYLKVTQKDTRPGAFPKIFQAIDAQMRMRFDGKRTEEVLPHLPPGTLDCGDQRVQSLPIRRPNRDSGIQIRGKLDALIRFDDGSIAVVDFKTTSVSGRNVETYTRQLSAYAYALENPAPGYLALRPVRRLGLLIFEPQSFSSQANAASFSGSLSWAEIPFSHDVFLKFLDEVASVLDLDAPPPTTEGCTWCGYRESARQTGY
jgi:hypothetical protein